MFSEFTLEMLVAFSHMNIRLLDGDIMDFTSRCRKMSYITENKQYFKLSTRISEMFLRLEIKENLAIKVDISFPELPQLVIELMSQANICTRLHPNISHLLLS